MALMRTENYEVLFDGESLKSTNLNTGEEFGEEYFLAIKPENALTYDFNLLLNTWDLLENVSRKHMTNETKDRLHLLENHLSKLVDIHMQRA